MEQQEQLAGISTGDANSVFSETSVKSQNLFGSPVPAPHALIFQPFGVMHLEAFHKHFQQIGGRMVQPQGTIDGDLQVAFFIFIGTQNRLVVVNGKTGGKRGS